jgi:N-acetylneuraminic acid mutarotase
MDTNGVPSARTNFTMVWTGNEVLVFGGKGTPANRDPYGVYNTGARYFPSLDAWMATSTFRAPEPRQGHSAVWTGTEMIVWGGYGLVRSNALGYLGSGARYNPALNLWSPMATNGAPSARWYHLAAWTGSEMPVWGGSPSGAVAGAKYDPLRDSWVSMTNRDAPQSRFGVPSVWTGQELLVWGNLGPSPDGYRYDPGADSWTRMTRTGLTYGRTGHSAVWTPFGMLVFGGTENNPQALPATTLQYTLSRPMYLYRRPSTAPPAPSVSALDRPSETAGSAAVR